MNNQDGGLRVSWKRVWMAASIEPGDAPVLPGPFFRRAGQCSALPEIAFAISGGGAQ
ncbi:MAG: hypothetical protein IPJ27_19545 [Candidatus Accumulibacter sp.]|uniref:Uncharacterized protein n=1 Tax=Candidatus Accumulibacter proximus TaxID=2954385 RepID=A0A935UHJ5_9PROT|nr:hypothetical protein [Candidatus Accumulibacter proximus]